MPKIDATLEIMRNNGELEAIKEKLFKKYGIE